MDVDRAQRDKVRDLVLQELRNLAEEDFTEDLKRVCKQTRVSRLRRRSSASGVASEMGADWFGSRNLNLSAWTPRAATPGMKKGPPPLRERP